MVPSDGGAAAESRVECWTRWADFSDDKDSRLSWCRVSGLSTENLDSSLNVRKTGSLGAAKQSFGRWRVVLWA